MFRSLSLSLHFLSLSLTPNNSMQQRWRHKSRGLLKCSNFRTREEEEDEEEEEEGEEEEAEEVRSAWLCQKKVRDAYLRKSEGR